MRCENQPNRRFQAPPAQAGRAFLVRAGQDLERIFSLSPFFQDGDDLLFAGQGTL